jgi:hypothetical protein
VPDRPWGNYGDPFMVTSHRFLYLYAGINPEIPVLWWIACGAIPSAQYVAFFRNREIGKVALETWGNLV